MTRTLKSRLFLGDHKIIAQLRREAEQALRTATTAEACGLPIDAAVFRRTAASCEEAARRREAGAE